MKKRMFANAFKYITYSDINVFLSNKVWPYSQGVTIFALAKRIIRPNCFMNNTNGLAYTTVVSISCHIHHIVIGNNGVTSQYHYVFEASGTRHGLDGGPLH